MYKIESFKFNKDHSIILKPHYRYIHIIQSLQPFQSLIEFIVQPIRNPINRIRIEYIKRQRVKTIALKTILVSINKFKNYFYLFVLKIGYLAILIF